MRGTLYFWTGLSIKSVLVGTHVCCLLRYRRRAALYSFHARRKLGPSSCLSGKPLVFHLKYGFQALRIRSQCLNPGNFRAFNLIQSCIIPYPPPFGTAGSLVLVWGRKCPYRQLFLTISGDPGRAFYQTFDMRKCTCVFMVDARFELTIKDRCPTVDATC